MLKVEANKIKIWYLAFFLLALCACKSAEDKENIVARVYDKKLLKSDLDEVVPEGTSKQDSIIMVKKYCQSWAEKNIMYIHSEKNLSEEQKNFEDKIEDYKASLLIYEFEKEFIRQKLDTAVSETEVNEYYKKHQSQFLLKESICRVKYIKTREQQEMPDDIKKMIRKSDEKSKKKLKQWCSRNAENFYLDEEKWFYFNDLVKEIPVKFISAESFLKTNQYLELKQDGFVYLLNILEFITKEEVSPLSLQYNNIKSFILNKRKIELINKLKADLIDDAKNKNEFILP